MQDVLYKVHRKVGAFRGDAALSSWIYRITFNTAMSRLRTARYQRRSPRSSTLSGVRRRRDRSAAHDVADWSDMADEHVLRSQLRQRVLRAILALPAIYRAPVMLRDMQGMSTEEASAMLRVKDQTLKSRLHRGRVILRKQLADFAGGLTLHHALRETTGRPRLTGTRPLRAVIALSSATRSRRASVGTSTATMPSGPSRTGIAAARGGCRSIVRRDEAPTIGAASARPSRRWPCWRQRPARTVPAATDDRRVLPPAGARARRARAWRRSRRWWRLPTE